MKKILALCIVILISTVVIYQIMHTEDEIKRPTLTPTGTVTAMPKGEEPKEKIVSTEEVEIRYKESIVVRDDGKEILEMQIKGKTDLGKIKLRVEKEYSGFGELSVKSMPSIIGIKKGEIYHIKLEINYISLEPTIEYVTIKGSSLEEERIFDAPLKIIYKPDPYSIVFTPGGLAYAVNVHCPSSPDYGIKPKYREITFNVGSDVITVTYRDTMMINAGKTQNNIFAVRPESSEIPKFAWKAGIWCKDHLDPLPEEITIEKMMDYYGVGAPMSPNPIGWIFTVELSPEVKGEYTVYIEVSSDKHGFIGYCPLQIIVI